MNRVIHDCMPQTASWAIVLMGLVISYSGSAVFAADRLMRVNPREVKVGGEIGRRIDVTVQNNLLKLKLDEDFLKPFRERKAKDGFTGLGMLLDATVRLAATPAIRTSWKSSGDWCRRSSRRRRRMVTSA